MFRFTPLSSIIICLFTIFQSASYLCAYEKDLVILIGVTRYENTEAFSDDSSTLRVGGDISVLSDRFSEGSRDGVELITQTDDSATLASLKALLSEKLAPGSCRNRRTVIVYFSGHGTVSPNDSEHVLLAVKDSSPTDEASFLCANEIRTMLSRCGAENCLFLVDACHAGGVKSASKPIIRNTDIPGVITLASCRNDESSGTWAEQNMSNFSYWLNEGLKGYADADRSGSVDTEELGNYISTNLGRKTQIQHPVVVKHPATDHFHLFKPRARQLYAVLDDIAEQIIIYASLKNISLFHSEGFAPISAMGTFRSADFGGNEFNDMKKVSSFCSSELPRRINLKSEGKLTVSPKADPNGPRLHCEIRRNNKYYFLNCTLSQANASTKSQNGASGDITIAQQVLLRATYETPAPTTPAQDYTPCRISIEVKTPTGYEVRPLEKIDGQYYAALNPGEVYRVALLRFAQPGTNPRRLGLKLFVDGCSVLPQSLAPVTASKFQVAGLPASEQGSNSNVFSAGTPLNTNSSEEVVLSTPEPQEAPKIPLEAARFFFLCGASLDTPYNFDARHTFPGFLKTTGEQAAYREFLVAPASESVGSGENIGMITAAIYELNQVESANETRGGGGTKEGEWGVTRAPAVNGISTGKLMQKVTIRYVPKNELPNYRQGSEGEIAFWAE